MIGIKTSDNVVFLGDALFSNETIYKYHLFFIYDVKEFLNTLKNLREMQGTLFIPAHCEATNDITDLIDVNENKVQEIKDKIYNYCKNEVTFEEVLKYIFDEYKLTMDASQYVLIGSTIRSYLSYLYDEDKLTYEFKNNQMLWSQK